MSGEVHGSVLFHPVYVDMMGIMFVGGAGIRLGLELSAGVGV